MNKSKRYLTATIAALIVCAPSITSAFSIGKSDTQFKSGTSHWGTVHYGQETIDNIHVTGSVDLEGTTVRDIVDATGNVHANHATIGKIHVNGKAKIEDSLIQDITEVNGKLVGSNSTFKKDVVCGSTKVNLKHCQLPTLTIHKITGYPGEQVVELTDHTIVSGPIVFESNNGKVIASTDSSFKEVRGGVLIRK